MLLIQNKAILDAFIARKNGSDYEFQNKSTGKVLVANKPKYNSYGFRNLLESAFYPNSVLILTFYLSNDWIEFRETIRKYFNYKGLKLSQDYSNYFKFEDKPNINFGNAFYSLSEAILIGIFNRRYVDALIEQVLPLLKNEEKAFDTFFELFSPDYQLRGKFTVAGNYLSNLPASVFSSSFQGEFDFDLTSLHGKILVGESGIELTDSSFVQNFEKVSEGLGLDNFTSQVPQDKLTEGDKLSYTDDMSNFSNWFYNLVNV